MIYKITDNHFRRTTQEWVRQDGEAWVDAGYRHSGGNGLIALVTSVDHLEKLLDYLASAESPPGDVVIFRRPKFLIRGIVDEELIAKAQDTFQENDVWMSAYSVPNDPLGRMHGWGDIGHQLMMKMLEECRRKYVVMGLDSDWPDPTQPYTDADLSKSIRATFE